MAKNKNLIDDNNGDAIELASIINKELKYNSAHDLESVEDFISTGSLLLDYAIANKKQGGIPCGRLTEIIGQESSGKSLLALQILKNTQLKGGVAVLLDTEHAASRDFIERLGLDLKKLVYIEPETLEDVFGTIELVIKKVKEKKPDKLVTIVLDSLAAVPPKAELEGDMEQNTIGLGARIVSKGLRKICELVGKENITLVFCNQMKMQVGGNSFLGPQWTTPYGMAPKYHASVRVKVSKSTELKEGDDIVGLLTKAKVIKNKVAPPLRTCEFNIYFDRGIDDVENWIDLLKKKGFVQSGGAWNSLKMPDGEEKKFQKKNIKEMLKDEKVRDYITKLLDDALIIPFTNVPEELLTEAEELNPIS